MNEERCVIVIDDDPSVRIGIGRLLRAAGYHVIVLSNINEFFGLKDTGGTCCLIVDIRMPGMGIEELVTNLPQASNANPIIVITADDDRETREIAKRINAVGFFRKPVDGSALLDAVRWAFRSMNDVV